MKYKSNKTKFGAIALILILLIVVGLLGWVTKGFANWDVTKWFAKEETKTEELEEETAEINVSASVLEDEPQLPYSSFSISSNYFWYLKDGKLILNNDFLVSVANGRNLMFSIFTCKSSSLNEQLLSFGLNSYAVNMDNFEDVFSYLSAFKDTGNVYIRTDYDWAGFDYLSYLDNDYVIAIRLVLDGIAYVSNFVVPSYNVILNANGGIVDPVLNYVNKNSLFIPPVPVRIGYRFLGWYTENSELYNNEIPVTESFILIAEWEPIIYIVQFNANGGECNTTSLLIQCGETFNLPVATRTGYNFKGWKLNGNSYTVSPVESNLNLIAEWELKILTVTFNSNGGSAITSIQVAYNNTFELPESARTGYIFKGWKLNGSAYVSSPVTENITLVASWDIIKLTVTFYVDGEAYKSILVDYGTTLYQLRQKSNELFLNIKSISFENLEDIGAEFIVTDNVLVIAEKQTTVQSFWSAILEYWYFVVTGAVVLALIAVLIFGKSPRRRRRL